MGPVMTLHDTGSLPPRPTARFLLPLKLMLGLIAWLRVPRPLRLPRLLRLPTRLLAAGLVLSGAAHGQEVVNNNIFFKSAEAARQAVNHYGTYDNRQELERIQDIGYRLAQESSFADYPFSFYLVDMTIPNAFALPGGQIFVTRGMLGLGLTDDMLATAIAIPARLRYPMAPARKAPIGSWGRQPQASCSANSCYAATAGSSRTRPTTPAFASQRKPASSPEASGR